MKKILRLFIVLTVFVIYTTQVFAQTTETFETEFGGSPSFTAGGQTFNIVSVAGGAFVIQANFPGTGWNGTSADNRYIDNDGYAQPGAPASFKITSTSSFKMNSIWLYLSIAGTGALQSSGTLTITGNLGGVQQFTATANGPYNTSTATNNGFTKIDFTTFGGANNAAKAINELVISTASNINYVALDAFTFTTTAPTITGNPSNRTICGGGNTTFSATASNATSYQWQVNTGSGFANISNFAPYSGATTTVLTITGATAAMNGYLYRLVANGIGSAMSNSGTLTVNQITATGSSTSVSCKGGANGTATVSNVAGGVAPYTYSWAPSGGTASTATGLTANNYYCTIIDNIGCTKVVTVSVTEPAALVSGTTFVTNVACNGGSNGAINLTPTGGTAPYTFLWSDGATTEDRTGLSASTYSVNITDAHGCTKVVSGITVGQPANALTITTTSLPTPQLGIAYSQTISTSGGTPSYTYGLTTGTLPPGLSLSTTTGTLTGTPTAGGTFNFTVTVTDGAGCTTSKGYSFNISNPAPVVTSVSVPADGIYGTGNTISFTVNFSASVTVTGTPRIAIMVGATTRYANYVSGSGTSGLVFNYTVANGDQDANGIAVNALSLNGGTIKDGTTDATLTLNNLGSTTNVLVDGSQPTVTSVSSSNANGTYGAGSTVTITVDFSSSVNVNTSGGTPTLSLNTGGTATYAGGSGTATLIFSYTVGAGENAADLDYSSTSSLALNGATITDAGGGHSNASLTLSAPGAAGSLGANKNIIVDTTAPTTTIATMALSSDTGPSSTDFITKTAAQTISGTLSANLQTGETVKVSIDNGNTYTTAAATVGSNTFSLSGVTLTGSSTIKVYVQDAAGNTGASYTQAYVLDTTAPTVTISSNVATVNANQTATITFTFSEDPGSTFTLGDITVSSGTLSSLSATANPLVYTATFTPPTGIANGSATISVSGGSYTDIAGNTGAAGSLPSLPFDTQLVQSVVTIEPFDPGPYVPGSAIAIPFHINNGASSIDQTNNFTLYMSDASGSFASPTLIGTISAASYATYFNAIIPAGLPAGTGYKFEIKASNPAITSAPSAAITVNATGTPATPGASNGFAPTNSAYPDTYANCSNPQTSPIFYTNSSTGALSTYLTIFNETTQTYVIQNQIIGIYTFSPQVANYTVIVKAVTTTGIVSTKAYTFINNRANSSLLSSGNNTVCLPAGGHATLTFGVDYTSASGIQNNYPGDTYTYTWGDGSTSTYTLAQIIALGGNISHNYTQASCGNVANGHNNVFEVDMDVSNKICGHIGTRATDYANILISPTNYITPITNDVATAGTAVTFTNGSVPGPDPSASSATCADNPNALYAWYVDGTLIQANYHKNQDFVYTFNTSGNHTIKLVAQNGNGVCTAPDYSYTIYAQPPPVINTSGTLTALSATYGTASASTSFNVSGTNMAAGITATAPTGFEVSGDNSTFSNTITVGAAGTIASTPVYVRLKAGDAANTYSDNVVLSSTYAANVNVATNGTVGKHSLDITANSVTKTVGTTITGSGSSTAFTSTGLQNSETIGTVTITYGAGSAAGDPVNTYTNSVVASAATGGTFSAANYTITYHSGDITVISAPTPTISSSGTLTAMSATYGTASTSSAFNLSGTNMHAGITATAPTGFEVSGDNSTFSNTVTIGAAGTIASTPVYVRLKAGDAANTYSGNVVLSSTDANNVNVAIANSTVNTKTVTVTATAQSKIYGDADPTLTYTFSPALVSGDNFSGTLTRDAGEAVGSYAIKQGTLALSSNYTLIYTGDNLTIGAKAIAITATAQSKTYGDADPSLTYTFSPALVTGDSFSGTLTRDAGENIGSYAIKQGTLSLNSNYTLTYTGDNLTIGTKAIAITATAKTKTYGDVDPTLTYTFSPALVTGDSFNGALTRDAGEAAGSYAIKQGTLSLNSNYTLTYTGANLDIGKKAIAVTATAKTKTYGDADPTLTYTFSPALVGTDTFSGALTRDAGEAVGSYAITQGTLALNSNYTLTYTGANLDIGKKAIAITATAKTKTYGDADPSLTYTFSPALVTGDSFTGGLTRAAGENIGSYAITQGTLSLNSNYTLTYTGDNLTIGAKAITVTATAQSKTYGDADPALTYTFSSALIGTDAFTGTLTRATGENIGSYAITQGTLTLNSNYTLTYTGANLDIGKKAIAVTATAKTKTYGDADPSLTYTFSPALVTGDSFTGALTRAAGENIGSYAITQGTLALNSNYTLTYTGDNLTIGTKAIAVTATAKTKTYGDADPALTYTFSPALVTGDSFNGALTRDAGEAAGSYAIKQGTLSLNSNYTLTYTGANLTIINATLTVTVQNQHKTYGGGNPVLTVSYSGFVNGDTQAGLTTPATAFTMATAASAVGTYSITANGAVMPGYSIVYIPGTLTVTKAILNVVADDKSRNYGEANPVLTVSYNGFVNGDNAASLTAQPAAITNATPASAPGKYAIVASGGASANYSFTYSSGMLTVLPLTNAVMTSLSISQGILSPAFSGSIYSYTASVSNAIDHITLTPTTDPTATISINGNLTANGVASAPLALTPGDNTITVLITAQDGITRNTYKLVVHRALPPAAIVANNILTPNGDGKNDVLSVKDIQLYPGNKVTVYDRAGREVYSKRDYNNDWGGTVGGNPLTQGTYYYTIYLGPGYETLRGYVTILKAQ